MRRLVIVWAFVIVIAVVAAGRVAVDRAHSDRDYRSVELCVDFDSAVEDASASGLSLTDEYLPRLRDLGVASLAVSERTLIDLVNERRLSVYSGQEILNRDRLSPIGSLPLRELIDKGALRPDSIYVLPGSSELHDLVTRHLPMWVKGKASAHLISAEGETVLELAGRAPDLYSMRLGLKQSQVEQSLGLGFAVVPRFSNPIDDQSDAIEDLISTCASEARFGPVIFTGNEILGYPDNIEYTASALRQIGMSPAFVEFVPQKGEEELAQLLDYKVIRAHSITPGEYAGLTPEEIVDRFVRAVKERNIRLLYIRPDLMETDLICPASLDVLEAVRVRLEREGFVIGRAMPYPEQGLASWHLLGLAVTLALSASGVLMLTLVYRFNFILQVSLVLLSVVGFEILRHFSALQSRLLLALGVAVVAPVGGTIVGLLFASSDGLARSDGRDRSPFRSAIVALRSWILSFCVALSGGVVVSGLLSDRAFFTKVEQFLGVKAAHTIPLALVGGLLWWYGWGELYSSGRLRPLRAVIHLAKQPIRVWHLAAAGALLIGLLIYIGRTGNTFVVQFPEFDARVRSVLETTLPVRPRTKEVFFGHPLLVLSFYLYARYGRRSWWSLCVATLGTIGLISIVNSFSHLHTPVALTALRVGLGALISLPLSVLLLVCVWLIERPLKYTDRVRSADRVSTQEVER